MSILLKLESLKPKLLMAALLVYAAFSDPTPDHPGWPELVIGILLIISIGIFRSLIVIADYEPHFSREPLELMSKVALFFLLLYPTFIGINNNLNDILRDLIPLGFLFIPLLTQSFLTKMHESKLDALPTMIWAVGVILSIRFFFITGFTLGQIGVQKFTYDRLLKLSTDPSIMFAAIYGVIGGIDKLNLKIPTKLLEGSVLFCGGLIALLCLTASVARGPTTLVLLSYIAVLLFRIRSSLKTTIIGITVGIFVAIYLKQEIIGLTGFMLDKQRIAGWSSKGAEFGMVLEHVSRLSKTLLFGKGWGALFAGPMYNSGVKVSYTHNIISYFLLKSGLTGCILLSFYAMWCVKRFIIVCSNNIILGLSLASPLLYGSILNPQFKYMMFGVLLSLLIVESNFLMKPFTDRQTTGYASGERVSNY